MTKLIALCAAALLSTAAIAAAPAQAQAATTSSATTQFTAGEKIYNANGDEIADVVSVSGTGANQKVVLSTSSFLGLGEKKVVVPASDLHIRTQGGLMTDLTEAQIKAMPAMK